MLLPLRFAWHFFKGFSRRNLFSMILQCIIIVGIGLGFFGLITTLSLLHGFREQLHQKIFSIDAHVVLYPLLQESQWFDPEALNTINDLPEVAAIHRINYFSGLLKHRSYDAIGTIRATESSQLSHLREFLVAGDSHLETNDNAHIPIILGYGLANKLNVDVAEDVVLFSYSEEEARDDVDIISFRVVGILKTGFVHIDDMVALTSREAMLPYLYENNHVDEVEIWLQKPADVEAIVDNIRIYVPNGFFSKTIFDRYANVFEWLKLQEELTPIIIGSLLIVGILNLIGSLLFVILLKWRDLAIMRAVGASRSLINSIFIYYGMIKTFLGIGVGFVFFFVFLILQNNYKVISLPIENYFLEYPILSPYYPEILLIVLITLMIGVLVSLIPTRVATKLNMIKILHWSK